MRCAKLAWDTTGASENPTSRRGGKRLKCPHLRAAPCVKSTAPRKGNETMAKELLLGQRIKLADLGLGSTLTLGFQGGGSADVACFGLDANSQLADARYMTSFNQPRTPCGGVVAKGAAAFDLDLGRLPSNIEVLVLTLSMDGAGTMADLHRMHCLRSTAGCHRSRRRPPPPHRPTTSPSYGRHSASAPRPHGPACACCTRRHAIRRKRHDR